MSGVSCWSVLERNEVCSLCLSRECAFCLSSSACFLRGWARAGSGFTRRYFCKECRVWTQLLAACKRLTPVWESGTVRVSLSPKGRCSLGTLQYGLSHLEELVASPWNDGRLVALGDREVKINGIVQKKEEEDLCHHLIAPRISSYRGIHLDTGARESAASRVMASIHHVP